MKNIQENILNKIKSGEVDMKPRWYYILRSLWLGLGVVIVALIGIYLLSFILFTLRQSGVGFIPLYGFRGISQFVISSPWLLITSVGAFLLLLQLLVSHYSFSYRRPLLYSTITIVFIVLAGSVALEKTNIHPRIQQFTEQHHTPFLAPMYRNLQNHRPDNLINGTIQELQPTGFTILSDQDEILTIIITDDTRQPYRKIYHPSDSVSVFGDRTGNTITAIGIRPLTNRNDYLPSKRAKHWDK